MAGGLRHKVIFEITGEIDDYIPGRGKMIITLYSAVTKEKKIKELISDTFNISENRVIVKKIEFIGEV